MSKKMLALFMSACMVLSGISMTAVADGDSGDLPEYEETEKSDEEEPGEEGSEGENKSEESEEEETGGDGTEKDGERNENALRRGPKTKARMQASDWILCTGTDEQGSSSVTIENEDIVRLLDGDGETEDDGTTENPLAGKTFQVEASVLPASDQENDSWTLVSAEEVDAKKTTAGSDYANQTFAVTLTVGSTETNGSAETAETNESTETNESMEANESAEADRSLYIKDEIEVRFAENTSLTFTLHYANAITEDGTAGSLKLTFTEQEQTAVKSEDGTAADGGDGSTATPLRFEIDLQIERVAAQINVTVPLYVCMYGYGGDGHVVTPNADAYALINNSDAPVQITSVQATQNGWNLKETPEQLGAGELFLKISDQVITSEEKSLPSDPKWRVEANGGSLSLPIQALIAGGSVNEDGENKVCVITYKAAISAESIPEE
jgi:hypothetical protein